MGRLPLLTLLLLTIAGGSFLAGRWVGERDLLTLLDMPAGGLLLSARHQALFEKKSGSTVAWLRIPSPYQAQLSRTFAAPSPPTTTTTTPPSGRKE